MTPPTLINVPPGNLGTSTAVQGPPPVRVDSPRWFHCALFTVDPGISNGGTLLLERPFMVKSFRPSPHVSGTLPSEGSFLTRVRMTKEYCPAFRGSWILPGN